MFEMINCTRKWEVSALVFGILQNCSATSCFVERSFSKFEKCFWRQKLSTRNPECFVCFFNHYAENWTFLIQFSKVQSFGTFFENCPAPIEFTFIRIEKNRFLFAKQCLFTFKMFFFVFSAHISYGKGKHLNRTSFFYIICQAPNLYLTLMVLPIKINWHEFSFVRFVFVEISRLF